MKKSLIGLSVIALIAFFVIRAQVPFPGGSGGGGGSSSATLTPPVQANWTGFNTTGMTQAITFANSRFEFATNAAASDNLQGLETALPTVPYTKVFRIWGFVSFAAFGRAGIGWSDGTKYVFCGHITSNNTDGDLGFDASNWTNVTTFASGISFQSGLTATSQYPAGIPTWWRLGDDGTNWTCDVSPDGVSWLNLMKEAHNTFLTATQLAVIADTGSSSQAIKMVFDSFK